jgi:hypothetical protein
MGAKTNGKGQKGKKGTKGGNKVVLWGPKKPEWTCKCGKKGNWASRLVCIACEKPAPQEVQKAARKAAAGKPLGKGKGKGDSGDQPSQSGTEAEPELEEDGEPNTEIEKNNQSIATIRGLPDSHEKDTILAQLEERKAQLEEEAEEEKLPATLQQAMVRRDRAKGKLQKAEEEKREKQAELVAAQEAMEAVQQRIELHTTTVKTMQEAIDGIQRKAVLGPATDLTSQLLAVVTNGKATTSEGATATGHSVEALEVLTKAVHAAQQEYNATNARLNAEADAALAAAKGAGAAAPRETGPPPLHVPPVPDDAFDELFADDEVMAEVAEAYGPEGGGKAKAVEVLKGHMAKRVRKA